jgi:hypothetical protein
MKSVLRIRLSTMLLLVLMIAVAFRFVVLKRNEVQLRADLAVYRNTQSEAIADLVDQPLTLTYPNQAALAVFLTDIRRNSARGTKLRAGIPIYVDPIGLSEVKKTMASAVEKPSADDKLTLREHLKRVLKPLGLGFMIKSGFLMITSEEAVDDPADDDPYLGFRDMLQE